MTASFIQAIFDELLSTQTVNVAHFARNFEWDIFCDFQPPVDDSWLFASIKKTLFSADICLLIFDANDIVHMSIMMEDLNGCKLRKYMRIQDANLALERESFLQNEGLSLSRTTQVSFGLKS